MGAAGVVGRAPWQHPWCLEGPPPWHLGQHSTVAAPVAAFLGVGPQQQQQQQRPPLPSTQPWESGSGGRPRRGRGKTWWLLWGWWQTFRSSMACTTMPPLEPQRWLQLGIAWWCPWGPLSGWASACTFPDYIKATYLGYYFILFFFKRELGSGLISTHQLFRV